MFMDHDMLNPAGFIDGRLVTVIRENRPLALIAPEDVGHAAAAALRAPNEWHGVTLQLAGDVLTLRQIVEILSRRDSLDYGLLTGTVEEVTAAGLHPGVAHGLAYMNVSPALGGPDEARSFGLRPTSFETWAWNQPRA